jgi:aldehyde dehydrogenase (NAD+)
MYEMDMSTSLKLMREYYESGVTKPLSFRKEQLQKLSNAIVNYEQEIYDALYADLKKSKEESWVTEIGILLAEIRFTLKHLEQWMKPEKVKTNLLNFPSSSFIYKEPLGVVLIISPWNYPFQLLLKPMVGAIAAGNCVVLKSSEYAPATSSVIKKIIESIFDSKFVLFTEGDGAAIVPEMMNSFVFDHVFFTGSTAVGKAVYQLAAKYLVPVTLELGGKSPCVIESDADIKTTARRIVLTKFSNCGQMCVAPDFLLVHSSKKEELVSALKETISLFFKEDAGNQPHYGKIINGKQFDRIVSYLDNGTIVHGGKHNKAELYIEPTVMDNIDIDSPIMNEEIFGPVLPVIAFNNKAEALAIISKNKNPLAFYVFTSDTSKEKDWINSVHFGGGCVNNASWHLTNHHLPFGGRGNSGIGQYQGKYSFDTFSHRKALMKTPFWFDPSLKYPPFLGKLGLLKKLVK